MLRVEQEKALATVLIESGRDCPRSAADQFEGASEEIALRGVPLVGVRNGVCGAMRGSRPDRGALRNLERQGL
jgi:hypothetical protein